MAPPDLAAAVATVRDRAAALRLGLEVPGAEEARRSRQELVRPARGLPAAPAAAGWTRRCSRWSAGRPARASRRWSTRWSGRRSAAAGVLRPTTRSPVLVCAPGGRAAGSPTAGSCPGWPGRPARDRRDAARCSWSPRPRVPAGLAAARRARHRLGGGRQPGAGRAAARRRRPVALRHHRRPVRRRGAVGPAAHRRSERGTALAVVLDRVPPEAMREVSGHLGRMLADGGLAGPPLFAVPEVPLGATGCCPRRRGAAAGLADRAGRRRRRPGRGRAADPGRGAAQHGRAGRRRSPGRRTTQAARPRRRCARTSTRSYAGGATPTSTTASAAGRVLRGEVLARWQEFVGTGELLRGLEARVGRVRDRVASCVTGRPLRRPEVARGGRVQRGVAGPGRGRPGRRAHGGRPGGRAPAARRCSARPGSVLARSSEDFRRAAARRGAGLAGRTCSTWCARRVRSGGRRPGWRPSA